MLALKTAAIALAALGIAHGRVAARAAPGNATVCGAGARTCPDAFSDTKEGCCVLGSDAVCCQNPLGPAGGLKRNFCCPRGSQCSAQGCTPLDPTFPCGPSQGENCTESFVCAPGPLPWAPQPGVRTVVVIGDSVSIGWTPQLAPLVNGSNASNPTMHVAHSPASGDGGARSTSDMLQCFRYRVATSVLEPLPLTKNDVVVFNFGLHDYNMGPAGVDEYASDLANITRRLQATLPAKLIFALTTPAHNTAKAIDDTTVKMLNTRAKAIMSSAGVPTVDLYSDVSSVCGPVPWADEGPSACRLCAPHCKSLAVHYTTEGYEFIAGKVLAAIEALE